MGQFSNDVGNFVRELVRRTAPAQAGLFSGLNPTRYNMNDPLSLWVIQVALIIAFTQLLSLLFGRIRQPRVIAEVIGGVLLGPTVFGRIPGFTAHIFPDASMPVLGLTSTLGLVIFLFLVGLEIDVRVIKKNIKASVAISLAGLVIPLGMGAALGVGIYRQFAEPTVNFGYFVLFSAVAVGITAFPVLCRILTETKLLDTTVGVVTLSAGVGNDVIGWVLLALTVALVNAGSGLTALWVLLTGVGFVLFMLFPVRWTYTWLVRRTGCLETGQPSNSMMTLTLLILFVSAFFTDVIGVHPIFGGFLTGLIIPHENGYAISLVEKLEDLVTIIFLPLYFTLSGLRTNLGLLNNGVTWGWTILLCTVSFLSKSLPCFTAAKLFGFNLRESAAVGALMSCKGLVELIVLNVGLQAGILDTRTFSMFVVHAIILTFMTTPITLWAYPPKYRTHSGVLKDKLGEPGADESAITKRFSENDMKTKFAIVLDKIEQLPAAMTLTQLLKSQAFMSSVPSQISTASVDEKSPVDAGIPALPLAAATTPNARITIDALRLIELTNRTSAVLKSQEADSIIHTDPVVSVFRTFGYLNRISVSAALNVVSYDEFTSSISNHARECESQLLIVPWCRGGGVNDEGTTSSAHNPFDGVFNKSAGHDQTSSVVYSNFIRKVFLDAPTDVALFVDRGIPSNASFANASSQHLFLPFFGGPDDRLALSFVVHLCSNPSVTATVVRMQKTASDILTPVDTVEAEKNAAALSAIHNTLTFADTIYGHGNTTTRLESATADTLLWDRYTTPSGTHSPAIMSALGRVAFSHSSSPKPLHTVLDLAASDVQRVSGRPPVVVIGRSRRLATESHQAELRQIIDERGLGSSSDSVPRTLGDVGAALVVSGVGASILVMQACL